MSHTAKAKAKGVSASSFFDLKAELSKQEAEFAKSKATGGSAQIVGGVKRPDKKPTVWARQNKGVGARASRDIQLEEISKPTLESARAVLERKAKIYDKLRKGKSGGLSDKQYESLLVDFDSKPDDAYESDSDEVDESLTVPKAPEDDDDPVIEYEDEFGRVRTARRSEVPRELLPRDDQDNRDSDDDLVIHNPVNHFPIYTPSAERVAEIAKEYAEENNPLNVHYDAAKEVRAKGAGYYQFSADEETRRQQMEELKAAREETGKTRKETGAVDVLPGEVEGMRETPTKSRAMEKRKREMEERRKMLEEKRKKPKTTHAESSKGLAAAPTTRPPEAAEINPFAVLESATAPTLTPKLTKKSVQKAGPIPDADAFLAQLEQDFLKGKKTR
ncbi:hypothetical protein P691DRAFT_665491 [Macrolepiota fuliginosa MF-IS2]|uniref:Uncharacterized protein n=1 Tax=Macrolepiota fuliginosa MF-IS2 TaxID=1400762 RepID=A0A9P6C6H7_9AGAR|nr:hypothetical protein P691DRAFT_665491 [Macrolepiota fuliginosa MF-IS2]